MATDTGLKQNSEFYQNCKCTDRIDTALQGAQLTRSEMIHKLMYLLQTGAKQLSSLIQVRLKTFL